MALNDTTADALGSTIAAAVTGLTDEQKADTELVWQTIVRALYAALKTDAAVTVTVTSVSGVTPGGGVSGPGAGTGVLT